MIKTLVGLAKAGVVWLVHEVVGLHVPHPNAKPAEVKPGVVLARCGVCGTVIARDRKGNWYKLRSVRP